MLQWFTCLLTFAFAAGAEQPFWKSKPKVYERIQNREVIVSVSEAAGAAQGRHVLRLSGAGQVAAPCDFVFKNAQRYEELAKTTGYVEKFQLDPGGQTMQVAIRVFGFSSEFKVQAIVKEGATPKALEFTVLTGPMNGFTWGLAFDPVQPSKCEVAISGEYSYETFPIPKLFLEFGLEVIFQRIAQRLRGFVEESFTRPQNEKRSSAACTYRPGPGRRVPSILRRAPRTRTG
jgi:hypothetical protein